MRAAIVLRSGNSVPVLSIQSVSANATALSPDVSSGFSSISALHANRSNNFDIPQYSPGVSQCSKWRQRPLFPRRFWRLERALRGIQIVTVFGVRLSVGVRNVADGSGVKIHAENFCFGSGVEFHRYSSR